MILLRCHTCRRGLNRFDAPIFACRCCAGRHWVPVQTLTLVDRWRLWRQLGVAPWTPLSPPPA